MRQRTLPCRWSNFWPLKTCPWTPNLLNRPILTLVISSDFRKWNHSYKGVVSRICTKSGGIADWCTRDTKKPVPGVLPAVAETLDPLHKLGRGLLRTEKKKTITKIRAYFVTDSVRELLNTPSYAWNIQGHKHCTAAQCDTKNHRLPDNTKHYQQLKERWRSTSRGWGTSTVLSMADFPNSSKSSTFGRRAEEVCPAGRNLPFCLYIPSLPPPI